MNISDMPINKPVWCVADLGDVIYHLSHSYIQNEFPTQHHVVITHVDNFLWLANDDQSIVTKIVRPNNVCMAVIAFTDMLKAFEEMEG